MIKLLKAYKEGGKIHMQIHDRIKAIREDADLTQEEMAAILKTERSYYGKYERGIRPIPNEHIITICKHFKISADWILGIPQGYAYPNTKIKIK